MFGEVFHMEKILGFCEKLWYIIGVNVMFAVTNLPALLFLLFVGPDQIRPCLPLFLFCLVPLGPALSAVFYTMNRLLAGTEGKAFADYTKAYRDDFIQKLMLCGVQMLLLLVFEINIEFFAVQVPVFGLMVLFVLLFAGVVLMTPNLYLLSSRYRMKNKDIIKSSLILLFTRPASTLGGVASLGIVLIFFELWAGTAVLFMGSIYGFLIAFMNQKVLQSLEENAA